MSNSEDLSLDDIGAASDSSEGFDDFAGIGEEKDSSQEGSVHESTSDIHEDAHGEQEPEYPEEYDDESFEESEAFDAGAIDKKPFWKTSNGIIAISCGVAILGYLGIQGPKMMQGNTPQQAVPAQQQLLSEANNTPQPLEGFQPPVIDNPSAVAGQSQVFENNQPAIVPQPAQQAPATVQQTPTNQVASASQAQANPQVSVAAKPVTAVASNSEEKAVTSVEASTDSAKRIAELEAKLEAANTQIGFIVAEIKSKNALYATDKANWEKTNKELTEKLEKLSKDHAALSKKVAGISWRVTQLRKAAKKTAKATASVKEHHTIAKFKITGFTDDEAWIYSERTKRTFPLSVGVPLKDFGKVISIGPDEVVFSKGGVIRP